MGDLSVNRWRRAGHERLYVNLPDRTAVAWADCRTGEVVIKDPAYRDEALALLRSYFPDGLVLRGESVRSPGEESPPEPLDRKPIQRLEASAHRQPRRRAPKARLPELTPMSDLARNRPGAGLLKELAMKGPTAAQRIAARLTGRAGEWDPVYTGLSGERRVGEELRRLEPHGWLALHGVPLPGGGDIDHLLMGQGGVFAINTKKHAGKAVWVGDAMARVDHGRPQPYAVAIKRQAAFAREVLERYCGFAVPVEPTLVFVGIAGLERAATQYTVRIYEDRELSALAPLKGVLTAEQVAVVYEVARNQRTWLA